MFLTDRIVPLRLVVQMDRQLFTLVLLRLSAVAWNVVNAGIITIRVISDVAVEKGYRFFLTKDSIVAVQHDLAGFTIAVDSVE